MESLFSQSLQVAAWVLVLEVLGLFVLPLLFRAFPKEAGPALGLAKPLGLLCCGWFTWLLQSVGLLHFTPTGCFFAAGAAAVLAALLGRFRPRDFLRLLEDSLPDWLRAEAIFFGSFLFFLAVRAFNPEIFWGEKPMDFSFLNYFIRHDALPPEDPWAAGERMHYYYFGSYLFAFLHKLSGAAPGVGYNLSIASIGALLASALYALLRLWTGRPKLAVFGSLLIPLCSNLEWIRLASAGQPFDFHFFWSTTRLFAFPAFAEYPSWALIFGDLHAHLMALPFFALFLTLASHLLLPSSARGRNEALTLSLLSALVWGSLISINSWDAMSGALILCLFGLFGGLSGEARILPSFVKSGAVIIGGLILFLPFIISSFPRAGSELDWADKDQFNSLSQIFRHFGIWILPVAFCLFVKAQRTDLQSRRALAGAAMSALLPPLLLSLNPASENDKPWGIILCSSLLLAASFLAASCAKRSRHFRSAAVCVFSGVLIISAAEPVAFVDRMNTIFKLYNSTWLLLGIAGTVLFGELLIESSKTAAIHLVCTIFFLLGLVGTGLNLYIAAVFELVPGPRPTLDGTAYLAANDPDEAALIDWINRNITGTPGILEAFGPPYGPFSRIAMHTGLPTVLGRKYHVLQRGLPKDEIIRRSQAIALAYASSYRGDFVRLSLIYGVRYVVWGELERQRYGSTGPLSRSGLKLIFERPSVRLYEIEEETVRLDSKP